MKQPERIIEYYPAPPDGQPEPCEYVRADIYDQLRALCKDLAEALALAENCMACSGGFPAASAEMMSINSTLAKADDLESMLESPQPKGSHAD